MPKPVNLEIIEPQHEAWRDFAEEIGGGRWFNVFHRDGACHVHIFGELNFGAHWERLVSEIGESRDIQLTVNCTGGDSLLGLAFYSAFHGEVAETRIVGRCYSAAVLVALSGRKILMRRDAKLMLHAPCSFAYEAAQGMAATARALQSTTAQIFSILKQRTELPDEVIASWLDGADIYMTAEQALAYHLIDEIFDPPPVIAPAPVAPALPSTTAAAAPMRTSPAFTDGEKLFYDFLAAFTPAGEKLEVHDLKFFLRELNAWATYNTTETPK